MHVYAYIINPDNNYLFLSYSWDHVQGKLLAGSEVYKKIIEDKFG